MQKTLVALQHEYDIVVFTDSFDTFFFSDLAELVAKFKSFNAPMVVSAEVAILTCY